MKHLKYISLSLFAILVVAMVVIGSLFAEPFRAAQSIVSPSEGLYTFTYEGDYGFEEFLAGGGASTSDEMALYITEFLTHGFVAPAPRTNDFGCSVMCIDGEQGGSIMARNFDWADDGDTDIVVVRTYPKDGYASVATSYIDFLGFGEEYAPRTMMERMALLATIYVPLDGMNECGVCVADLIVADGEIINQQSERADLTITAAIRLLLDRAATVEEALLLLEQYDIHSDIGQAHHLAVSDSTGRSVVVEWIDNQMVVTESALCTNHYLAPHRTTPSGGESHQRYSALQAQHDHTEQMSVEQAMASIRSVADGSTRWSVVFDSHSLQATYCQRGDVFATSLK